jgi:CheY-like chemotaxis protein
MGWVSTEDVDAMSRSNSGTRMLRILCLEDSPEDAELVHETLSNAAIQFEMRVASDRSDFVELLARGLRHDR